jgi:hypothetical protein
VGNARFKVLKFYSPALMRPVVIHAARINKTRPVMNRNAAKMMGLCRRRTSRIRWDASMAGLQTSNREKFSI